MTRNRRLIRGAPAGVVAAAALFAAATASVPTAASGASLPPAPPPPAATVPTTGPATTTTTASPSAGGGSGRDAPASDSPSGQSGAQSSEPAADSPQIEAMKAQAASVHRTPPSSTLPLLTALAPLGQVGFNQMQEALVGFGGFPVGGPASYADDWLEFRPGPPAGLHPGIDIQAAESTPIRAPATGTLTYNDSDPNGYGLAAMVTQPDKTVFLMAHMSATVLGLSSGAQVEAGQVIGFVGATGNATGPHVHFEVHPFGGAGIDGKPFLDEALARALAAAPSVVAEYTGHASPAVTPPPPVTVPAALPVAPASPSVRAHLVRHATADIPRALARAAGVVVAVGSVTLSVDRLRRRRARAAI